MFTGIIGKLPIVMELEFGKSHKISGRYFYRKYGKSLPLSGTLADPDEMTLVEGLSDQDEAPHALMTLRKCTAGGWQGTWKNAKAKALPMEISPLPPSARREGA